MLTVVQGIEEQFRCDNLQIEYERRAQERRQALDRNNYNLHIPPSLDVQDINADISNERRIETSENNFSYSNPAPAPNPAPNPAPQYVPQGKLKFTKFYISENFFILPLQIYRS